MESSSDQNAMKVIALIVLVSFTLFISSCSVKVMEATAGHKMHDEKLILFKNGWYTTKMMFMGVLKIPQELGGRYVMSGDTVYFINKIHRKTFETFAYGIIDTASRQFYYRPPNEDNWETYGIEKISIQKIYRGNSHTVR